MVRLIATAVVAGVAATSSSAALALPLVVPALVALVLARASCRRRVLRALPVCWVLAALLLVVAPVWIVVDLSPARRWLALSAALTVLVSVITALCVQPAWYDPERSMPASWEWIRRLSGPLTAMGTVAIVVPGPWPSDLMPAVWALAAVPLITGARVYGVDQSLRHALPVIREEGQLGRDQILRDIHGALSTELRQLEQRAREFRLTSPALYEVAVNANSGLRETLTLAEENRETSTTTDTLTAPVLTLTRAEGASAAFHIQAGDLDANDREIARYVLNELVGDALRGGASRLEVKIVREVQHLVVTVRDDAPAEDGADVASEGQQRTASRSGSGSAQLEQKLIALSGSLAVHEPTDEPSRTVVARWRART